MSGHGWPRAMPIATAAEYVGLSASTVRRLCGAGEFPKPVNITDARIAWLKEDLDAWLDMKAGKVRAPALDGWRNS